MAIYGLDLTTTFRYVDDTDPAKGTPEETVFYLKSLDSNVMGRIADRMTDYQLSTEGDVPSAKMQLNQAAYEAARFSIDRWENFKLSPGGPEVKCEKELEHVGGATYQVLTKDCVGQIPMMVLRGIFTAAREQNELDREDEKNSEVEQSPSSSSPKETAPPAQKATKKSGAA